MSVVTVQIGQCGNQLGECFLDTLARELASGGYDEQGWETFFRTEFGGSRAGASSTRVARAILVDMEPKVIQSALSVRRKCPHWKYCSDYVLTQQSGAGNNWALGYNQHGHRFREVIMDAVRREAEQCDLFGGILMLQSMAGGTGAGFGAQLVEAIREELPSSFLFNHCVWPHSSGEVVVQNYNALLTMSHLLDQVNGAIIVENDVLHETCRRLLHINRPSFADMNAVAARSLACAFLPSRLRLSHGPGLQGSGSGSRNSGQSCRMMGEVALDRQREALDSRQTCFLADFVEHLCPHPRYRLLGLCSVPQLPVVSIDFTTFTWQAILKRLQQMLFIGSPLEQGIDCGYAGYAGAGGTQNHKRARNKSVANLLVLRGAASGHADVSGFQTQKSTPPGILTHCECALIWQRLPGMKWLPLCSATLSSVFVP